MPKLKILAWLFKSNIEHLVHIKKEIAGLSFFLLIFLSELGFEQFYSFSNKIFNLQITGLKYYGIKK